MFNIEYEQLCMSSKRLTTSMIRLMINVSYQDEVTSRRPY